MVAPRMYVLGMAAVWAATGLIEPHTPHAGEPMNEIGLIQIVVWAILIFGWVKAHARSRAAIPATGSAVFAALLPPLGVPYYALRTFGLREGAKLTGLALLTLLALIAIYLLLFELSARSGA